MFNDRLNFGVVGRVTIVGCLACLAACSQVGCTGEVDQVDVLPAAGTEKLAQPLYGLGTLATAWANGVVPACFENFVAGDARYEKIRWILTDTWGAVANLRFTGFGACPAPDTPGNRLAVSFSSDPNWRGQSIGLGQGNRRIILNASDDSFPAPDSSTGFNISGFRYQVIHEVGHALGFAHEQQRPDNWTYNPDGTPNSSLGCPAVDTDMDNWLPVAGGTNITAYDPHSIMGYCSREPGSSSGFVQNLSANDVGGVRTIYGTASPRARRRRGILWRNQNNGDVVEWHMQGRQYSAAIPTNSMITEGNDFSWQIQGTGDFDGDGIGDILWRHTNGQVATADPACVDRAVMISTTG